VHAAGRIALQLFHAGGNAYFASFGIQPVAPSAIRRASRRIRRARWRAEIVETIGDFARGAAHAANWIRPVEVMASEVTPHQFLSPLTNRRDDAWGGDLERRMHLLARSCARSARLPGASFP